MGCCPPTPSPARSDVRPAEPDVCQSFSRCGCRGGHRRDGVLQRGHVRSRRTVPRRPGSGGRRDRTCPVTAEINQLRDNYSRQIIAIQLTNTTAGPVTVLGARASSPLFSGTIEWPATPGGIELPPGQTKILPAQLRAPDCGPPADRTERGTPRWHFSWPEANGNRARTRRCPPPTPMAC